MATKNLKKAKLYNIRPARGQALLSYQNRLAPSVGLPRYDAKIIEQVRPNGQSKLGAQTNGNYLLQGDCLSVCAWLLDADIRPDLVYIDPPFASGADYAKKIYLRNGGEMKESSEPSLGEEAMYDDIWQKEDYLNWLYERLLAIREVMAENGSIYVHLDWHIGHYVKVMLDEIFGEGNFVNEIIWSYKSGGASKGAFATKHDTLFLYSKSSDYIFNGQKEKSYNRDLRRYGFAGITEYEDEMGWYTLVNMRDVWDIDMVGRTSKERMDYPTQKPESLLERIIKASSNEDMVVADFFSGSGTTAKVAHSLGRRFVAGDIGLNAVQTTRDRLAKAGVVFDRLKIQDGVRLFRNPKQTEERIFAQLPGWLPQGKSEFGKFWDGAIPAAKGKYAPVKYVGLDKKLTMQLIDTVLTEAVETDAGEVIVIYARKADNVSQSEVDKQAKKYRRGDARLLLKSLDELLDEKSGQFFTADSALIEIAKSGKQWRVVIKRFCSPYLQNKIVDHNDRRPITQGTKPITISDRGLELIECVQFDLTNTAGAWTSAPNLEDRPPDNKKIKGEYVVAAKTFRIKIRNIAGDEIIYAVDGKKIMAEDDHTA